MNPGDRLIGRGSFNCIFQKSATDLLRSRSATGLKTLKNSTRTLETDESIISSASSIRSENIFAVKRLRNDLYGDDLTTGIYDLQKEARFLMKLSHPNIIFCIGFSGAPGTRNFSVLLDRLEMTFADKFERWQKWEDTGNRTSVSSTPSNRRKTVKSTLEDMLDDRIRTGYGLASALKYLHARQ